MKAKKLLALTMIAGLVAGSAVTADAKKKKPKPKKKTVFVAKPVNYYVSFTAEEGATCTTEGAKYLSVTATQGASSCGHLFYGAVAEALITAGQEGALDAAGLSPHATVYPAVDGVPFILDATKAITGEVVIKSRSVVANGQTVAQNVGTGKAKLTVLLTGTTGGETVTLGEAAVDYDHAPQSTPKVEFSLEPIAELDKAAFESLELTLRTRGASAGGSFYSSAGDSFLTVPTYLKKTVVVKK